MAKSETIAQRKFTIGIAGGCINTGFGEVPLSALYHRLLAKDFATKGINLRIRLASITSNHPADHLQQARNLIEKKKCQHLIYQIRPTWLWMLSSAIWVKDHEETIFNTRINLFTHPPSKDTASLNIEGYRGTAKLQFLNRKLSNILRTDKLGQSIIGQTLVDLQMLCSSKNVQLWIMGPCFGSWFPEYFPKIVNSYLPQEATKQELCYIDLSKELNTSNKNVWSHDAAHLNRLGHKTLAKIIAKNVEKSLLDNL